MEEYNLQAYRAAVLEKGGSERVGYVQPYNRTTAFTALNRSRTCTITFLMNITRIWNEAGIGVNPANGYRSRNPTRMEMIIIGRTHTSPRSKFPALSAAAKAKGPRGGGRGGGLAYQETVLDVHTVP